MVPRTSGVVIVILVSTTTFIIIYNIYENIIVVSDMGAKLGKSIHTWAG
jgi:hypothetical protein